MSEHTPTPWAIESSGEQIWSTTELGEKRAPIARMEGWRQWLGQQNLTCEQRKANAAFIVKAVNCHDTMVNCLRWLDRRGGLGLDVHENIRQVLDLVGGAARD